MAARSEISGNVDIEHLSSLIDGELDPIAAAAVIQALCRDPELQRRWSDLQLVGDALRSSDVAACHVEGFCLRVQHALRAEPTVLAPKAQRVAWRRVAVPAAAIAASVAAIAFVAMPLLRAPAPDLAARGPQVAPSATTTVATAGTAPLAAADAKAAVAISSARALDPYFAAHRELTGGTPLPRATVYLRTSGGDR